MSVKLINKRYDENSNLDVYLIQDKNLIKIGIKQNDAITRENIILDRPISVHLNITNKCNLRCSHCYANNFLNTSDEVSINENIFGIMDKLKEEGIFILEWSGGEPFMDKDFINILEYANNLGFYQSIITNATLLDNHTLMNRLSKLNISIEVSLDGANESVDKIKGSGVYSTILKNIKKLNEYNIVNIVKFTILKDNVDDIDIFINDMINSSVKAIKFGLLIPTGAAENENYDTYMSHTLNTAKTNILNLKHKYNSKINIIDPFTQQYYTKDSFGKRPKLCEASYTRMYIDNNGDAYACPLFKGSENFICGNILNDSISDIWNSHNMNLLRNVSLIDTGCESCNLICRKWCRAITYSISKNLKSPSVLCKNKGE